MFIASSAVKRLRRLYRFVFHRMREHEARLFGGLGRPGVGRLCGEGVSRTCRIEQLEPRLMLDAVGPQVVAHWPTGLVAPADHVDITFNEPINPATLSAGDVLVMHSSPTLLGGYDTSGSARGVAMAGDLAYVADYQSGLQIIDMSDPAAPLRLGGYNTPGNATAVDVAGTFAFVADYSSGLQIFDVSNPATPVRRGRYDTPGIAFGVAVSGTLAYVADHSRGLQIIDVSVPTAPVLLGTYNTAGLAYGVTLSGTTAYVADRAAGLQIIDVTDPAAPVLLGTYDTAGSAFAVTVSGTTAYVADDTAGLQIIDISDPAAPTLLGTYDTAGNAYDVSVSGRLAYVSDGVAGVQVVDVSDPSAPTLLTTYDTADIAYGAAISNGRAYVADGGTGVQIIAMQAAAGTGVAQMDATTTYRINLAGALAAGDYTVRVYPAAEDLAGNPMDQDIDGVGGELPDDIYTFSFAVQTSSPAPAVVSVDGRYVFYNDSAWDGNDPAATDIDDAAIAMGASALLPGQAAAPENIINYAKGINGVIIDIANMSAGSLTADDFVFRVGTGGATALRAGPAPSAVTVRPGAGEGGNARVTITWPGGSIVGTWLEVTVLSDANGGHAGLAADDVFYFGNLPGDANADSKVDSADYIALKRKMGTNVAAAGESADFDGSGVVDRGDLMVLSGRLGMTVAAAFWAPATTPQAEIDTAESLSVAIAEPQADATWDALAMSAALVALDEPSSSLPAAIQSAAIPASPLATVAAAGPVTRFRRLLSDTPEIDLLCDSPTRWPALVGPSATSLASADADLLALRPINLQTIAPPLSA